MRETLVRVASLSFRAKNLVMIALLTTGCPDKWRPPQAVSPAPIKVADADSVIQVAAEGNTIISSTIPKSGEGQSSESQGKGKGKGKDERPKRICVAPPAQAALRLEIQAEARGSLKAGDKLDLSGESIDNLKRGAESLFAQNEQTLFVQHADVSPMRSYGQHRAA